ncbi:MAG: class I SAM-dependent methyltransferase [Ignavibacteriales bacterium]|nr:class I SAM-dependent methyltransferase [Ignavibacteriales bacterium]
MSSSAFDTYAPSYDSHFEDNPITKYIRNVVQQTMLKYFQKGNSILELNCGTGTDAIFLAKNGMNILATDASQGMVEVAKEKIVRENLSDKIMLQQLSFENIASLSPSLGFARDDETLHGERSRTIDGILSNFGGLNCATNLHQVAKDISEILKPNGYFLLGMINKFCLWESLSFLARLNFSKAFRRLRKSGCNANVNGEYVRIYYYFADEIVKIFSPFFMCQEIYGLNFLSPNPNSISFYNKFPLLSQQLLHLENERRHTYPLYNFSDHIVLVLKKR